MSYYDADGWYIERIMRMPTVEALDEELALWTRSIVGHYRRVPKQEHAYALEGLGELVSAANARRVELYDHAIWRAQARAAYCAERDANVRER
jgi:hypothetical protein